MNEYTNLIEINPIFQSSVNVEFDFGNESKIAQYIPTRDACMLMRYYLSSMLDARKRADRATTLIGPYGKGKSFLIVVLLYLISADSARKAYQDLVGRIKRVDPELSGLIKQLNNKKIRLLPAIINSDYDNLEQAFSIALNEALHREGLSNLIPASAFDYALDIIDKWKNDSDASRKLLSDCEVRTKKRISDIEDGLKRQDRRSFKDFKKIYKCVTYGVEFNPLVRNDVSRNISNVADELSKYGWSGIFFVFDEFSKFIGGEESYLGRGLKVLQDIFELATRSGSLDQVHLCCITHQPLNQYAKHLSETMQNSFRTIEGRVQTKSFTRSIGEDFQVVSWALHKTELFDATYKSAADLYPSCPIYGWLDNSQYFADSDKDILYRGCFPLNPFSTLALVRLSELVAQNERTLFTFISDNDRSSLNTFIQSTGTGLLNVDTVYDYFSQLLEKDDDPSIRSVNRSCKLALKRTKDRDAVRFIKTLAVSLIIGVDDFPPYVDAISMAAGLGERNGEVVLESLLEEGIVRKDIFTNHIFFAPGNNEAIKALIDSQRKKAMRGMSLSDALNRIDDSHYFIPRAYNTTIKMTRFFKAVYITEDRLLGLGSLSNAFRFDGCTEADGVVLLVVRSYDSQYSNKELKSAISSNLKPDGRVAIVIPNTVMPFDVGTCITDTVALSMVSEDQKLEQSVRDEMKMMLDLNQQSINAFITSSYSDDADVIVWGISQSEKKLNSTLSELLSKSFPKTPVINNSLINLNHISSQYATARNQIVDYIINGKDISDLSATSPAMTINNAVDMDEPSVADIVYEMRDIIVENEGAVKSFSDIARKFMTPPYGIRRGVMPVLFARALSLLPHSTILLLRNNKELPYSGEMIGKAFDNPDAYSYKIIPGTEQLATQIAKLVTVFGGEAGAGFRENVQIAVNQMNRFCYALPPIVRDSKPGRNIVGLSDRALVFKQHLMKADLNPFNILLDVLPSIFLAKNAADPVFVKGLADVKLELEHALQVYMNQLSFGFNNMFGMDAGNSIASTIKAWRQEKLGPRGLMALDVTSKKLEDFFYGASLSFDNNSVIDSIAYVTTGAYVADWNSSARFDVMVDDLKTYKEKAEAADVADKESNGNEFADSVSDVISEYASHDDSIFSSPIKNEMRSIREQYGESITTEQFVGVLAALIKELTQ